MIGKQVEYGTQDSLLKVIMIKLIVNKSSVICCEWINMIYNQVGHC